MKKAICSMSVFVLFISVFLGFPFWVVAVNDESNYWYWFDPVVLQMSYEEELAKAVNLLYLMWATKYKNMVDYNPESNITREQVAKMVFVRYVRAFWDKSTQNDLLERWAWIWEADWKESCKFSDISDWLSDPSLTNYIYSSCEIWFFKWYNLMFKPTENIKRWDFFLVILRSLWVVTETEEGIFALSVANWLTKTKTYEEFNYYGNITRGQVALILSRASSSF